MKLTRLRRAEFCLKFSDKKVFCYILSFRDIWPNFNEQIFLVKIHLADLDVHFRIVNC